jgi:hypothetical protein
MIYRKSPTDAKLNTDIRDKMDTEQEPDSQPARKRPRIDLGVGERKRGKSMFGIVLGTLNKAKIEDKERNASEAVSITYTRVYSLECRIYFSPG